MYAFVLQVNVIMIKVAKVKEIYTAVGCVLFFAHFGPNADENG